jgi:hypothetical protein
MDELRQHLETGGRLKRFDVIELRRFSGINRAEKDLLIVAGGQPAAGDEVDCEVNGYGMFMEEVERPNVYRASGKIYPGGRSSFNYHSGFRIQDSEFRNYAQTLSRTAES